MKAASGFVVLLLLAGGIYWAFTNAKPSTSMETTQATSTVPQVVPIMHASLVLKWGSTTVYADPVGDAEMYAAEPRPDIIFVTRIKNENAASCKMVVHVRVCWAPLSWSGHRG